MVIAEHSQRPEQDCRVEPSDAAASNERQNSTGDPFAHDLPDDDASLIRLVPVPPTDDAKSQIKAMIPANDDRPERNGALADNSELHSVLDVPIPAADSLEAPGEPAALVTSTAPTAAPHAVSTTHRHVPRTGFFGRRLDILVFNTRMIFFHTTKTALALAGTIAIGTGFVANSVYVHRAFEAGEVQSGRGLLFGYVALAVGSWGLHRAIAGINRAMRQTYDDYSH